MTTIQNETKVQALLKVGKPLEAIIDYLVMNDDYRTKPEARTALTAYVEANNLVPAKKVPMSEQFKTWFKALSASDKKAQTKETLCAQAVALGMSDKSADWYARVYLLANELAQDMAQAEDIAPVDIYDDNFTDVRDVVPAVEAPRTKCAKSLLACADYEALDAWVAKYTKNDVFTPQALDALNYASAQVDTDLSVMILSNLTW